VTRLDEIPGIGITAAQTIIAEIGLDNMTRFPTRADLASWARYAPGSLNPPAGKRKKAPAGAVTGTGTSPGPWVRRGRRRPHPHLPRRAVPQDRPQTGKKRAIVAVGRSTLMIVWQLLNDPEK
jgi:hypothetical protein